MRILQCQKVQTEITKKNCFLLPRELGTVTPTVQRSLRDTCLSLSEHHKSRARPPCHPASVLSVWPPGRNGRGAAWCRNRTCAATRAPASWARGQNCDSIVLRKRVAPPLQLSLCRDPVSSHASRHWRLQAGGISSSTQPTRRCEHLRLHKTELTFEPRPSRASHVCTLNLK